MPYGLHRGLTGFCLASIRVISLVCFSLITLGLIAFLQWYQLVSQRDGGAVLVPDANQIYLNERSWCLYVPAAIVMLLVSTWTWIDADVIRKESLEVPAEVPGIANRMGDLFFALLSHAALRPFHALSKRRWPAFLSSTVVVLIFWGLAFLQASIFTRGTTSQHADLALQMRSADHVQATVPQIDIGLSYLVYSQAHGTARLPRPYTTESVVVRGLQGPAPLNTVHNGEVWTYPTTQYSMDLDCKPAQTLLNSSGQFYTSDFGCTIPQYGPTGSEIKEDLSKSKIGGNIIAHRYNSFYAGFDGPSGDPKLSDYCPNAQTMFLAVFSKIRNAAADPVHTPTAIFCRPRFYAENVTASIELPSQKIQSISRTAATREIPSRSLVDPETFMRYTNPEQLHDQIFRNHTASSLPRYTISSPTDSQHLVDKAMPLSSTFKYFSGLVPLEKVEPFPGLAQLPQTVADVHELPLDSFLNHKNLARCYESAFQLFFLEAVGYRLTLLDETQLDPVNVTRSYNVEAIMMDKLYTRIVQSVLCAILVLSFALTVLTIKQTPRFKDVEAHSPSIEEQHQPEKISLLPSNLSEEIIKPSTPVTPTAFHEDANVVSAWPRKSRHTREHFLLSLSIALALISASHYIFAKPAVDFT